jgi:Fe-S oxidoreductase
MHLRLPGCFRDGIRPGPDPANDPTRREDRLLSSHDIWLCASCETCGTRCPNEIDISRVMDALRGLALAEKASIAEPETSAITMGDPMINICFPYSLGKALRIFLRLKNIKILDQVLKDKPPVYRSLDVSVLNRIILENILAVDLQNKDALTYSPDAEEFIREVDNSPSYIAFFLNPVKAEQIIEVALNKERMPPKSTYFYPFYNMNYQEYYIYKYCG